MSLFSLLLPGEGGKVVLSFFAGTDPSQVPYLHWSLFWMEKQGEEGQCGSYFEEQWYGYQANETTSGPMFCMPSNTLVWH